MSEKPILFFNVGEEHREAFRSIKNSGIDCVFRAASDSEKPCILDGYTPYQGIDEIREFIQNYK